MTLFFSVGALLPTALNARQRKSYRRMCSSIVQTLNSVSLPVIQVDEPNIMIGICVTSVFVNFMKQDFRFACGI
jgi:hypothetical protein